MPRIRRLITTLAGGALAVAILAVVGTLCALGLSAILVIVVLDEAWQEWRAGF